MAKALSGSATSVASKPDSKTISTMVGAGYGFLREITCPASVGANPKVRKAQRVACGLFVYTEVKA